MSGMTELHSQEGARATDGQNVGWCVCGGGGRGEGAAQSGRASHLSTVGCCSNYPQPCRHTGSTNRTRRDCNMSATPRAAHCPCVRENHREREGGGVPRDGERVGDDRCKKWGRGAHPRPASARLLAALSPAVTTATRRRPAVEFKMDRCVTDTTVWLVPAATCTTSS